MKRSLMVVLISISALATGAVLLGAAPPGVAPSPRGLPGCDPCVGCSITFDTNGFTQSIVAGGCNLGMSELQLQISDGNNVATYELKETHGLEEVGPDESVELEFDDPGFTPNEAKLNYTLDDGSYGTSDLTIK